MEWAVRVDNLEKVYAPSPRWMRFLLRSNVTSPIVALRGISLRVRPGEVCAIVGPNGAGKSTLFRVLTGLTTATSGTTEIHGLDVHSSARAVRAQIGFVPAGDQTLYLRLTCFDNLLFHGQLAGMGGRELRQRITDSLEIVGIGHAADRAGFALSAGMRARLQLARAMLHRPKVLILDEPTATVDPVGSYELLQIILAAAREEEVAVLLSSHRLEEIEAMHKRIVLMNDGSIIYDGPLSGLPSTVSQRRIRVRFNSPVACVAARERLGSMGPGLVMIPADLDESDQLQVATELSVGDFVSALGELTRTVTAVEEAKPALREVIYGILQSGKANQQSPSDAQPREINVL